MSADNGWHGIMEGYSTSINSKHRYRFTDTANTSTTMSTSNVHIKFFADTPFSENLLSSVAVFTKLFSAETGHTYCVAWEVLRPLPQQTLEFVYPTTTQSIGASYQTDEKNGIGPFSAELGSTWEINQEVEDTPTLKIGLYNIL